ncbi:hypothetical protein [Micromonospora chersina]|uniref:PH domain-containing protein n=1 Tax=Micromonospora chersina TaxID=47854 RepID=A0A1C6VAQ3_9ACTN|nr:hypothetical protein [Micromonospora chersina]SCL63247.1 hypothetical protein GA0070603_3560 [Micromonospora chersina]
MISKVSAAAVRHRHVVLLLGLLVAGVNAAAVGFASALGQVLFTPLLLLAVVVLLLSVIAVGIRPACFVVLPQVPAFATPAPAWKVFFALGFLGPGSANVGAVVRSARAGMASTFDVVMTISWLALVALLLVEAWRGHDVQLRPHGIQQRWVLGSLTVPWEAVPAAQVPAGADRPSRLRMTFAEPLLVRRRGLPWGWNALRTDSVDARFLAAAIRHYVGHPEHRAVIGSQAEYRRLLADLADRNGGSDESITGPDCPPAPPAQRAF